MRISDQDLKYLLDRIRKHAPVSIKPFRHIVVFGPSGSGKTTIIRGAGQSIISLHPEIYDFSISATTRKERANERYGIDYFFMDELIFKMRQFIEDNNYGGNSKLYGTLVSEVERIMLQFRKRAVFDVDINGAKELKEIFGDDLLMAYLKVSQQTLRARLINRLPITGETMEDVDRRLKAAEKEQTMVEEGFVTPDLILPYEDKMKPGEAAIIISQHAHVAVAA